MGMPSTQTPAAPPAGASGKSSSTAAPASGSAPQAGAPNFMQLFQGMLQQQGGQVSSAGTQGKSASQAQQPQQPPLVGMPYSANQGAPQAQGYQGYMADSSNPNTGGAGMGAMQSPSTSQGGMGFGGESRSTSGVL